MQQFIGSNIDFADDKPYYYGLGMGDEKPHPDLPGLVSSTANEYYARAFFSRWREALESVDQTALAGPASAGDIAVAEMN